MSGGGCIWELWVGDEVSLDASYVVENALWL